LSRATPAATAASATARATVGATAPVEHARDDVVGGELVVGDDVCERMRRSELHLSGDRGRPDVERAAEDARKGEHVVDLVRVVRAAGRDDRREILDLLRFDLGARVREREDDRVVRHAADSGTRDGAGNREADEDIGALQYLVGRAALAGGVRQLGVLALGVVQVRAAVVEGAVLVAADDRARTGGEEELRHGGRRRHHSRWSRS